MCMCARARVYMCVCVRACLCMCVCVCVCVYARMYVTDGWAGIACTVTANTSVVTEADN